MSHIKEEHGIKLPAMDIVKKYHTSILENQLSPFEPYPSQETFRDISYNVKGKEGHLHFNFYNGAMNTDQCVRLRKAFMRVNHGTEDIIVLRAGQDIWSNGINLNCIEVSSSPGNESWNNIVAIDDLIREIIYCDNKVVVSAMAGNAGAGGVTLALAADFIYSRNGIVLNPHYKNMGLFGSEYWTYLLPKRVGEDKAKQLTEQCLPIDATEAKKIGMLDDCFGNSLSEFNESLFNRLNFLSDSGNVHSIINRKRKRRLEDDSLKSIDSYRNNELANMWNNFYEDDNNYNARRYSFVNNIN